MSKQEGMHCSDHVVEALIDGVISAVVEIDLRAVHSDGAFAGNQCGQIQAHAHQHSLVTHHFATNSSSGQAWRDTEQHITCILVLNNQRFSPDKSELLCFWGQQWTRSICQLSDNAVT